MSYRNPKQVIDRRSSVVNNAVGQMLATISKNQQTFALAKKKEKAAQQLVLDKATASARSGYDQSFQKAQAAGNKFTSQLTDGVPLDLADDVIKVLSVAGMKYYKELKGNFDK